MIYLQFTLCTVTLRFYLQTKILSLTEREDSNDHDDDNNNDGGDKEEIVKERNKVMVKNEIKME